MTTARQEAEQELAYAVGKTRAAELIAAALTEERAAGRADGIREAAAALQHKFDQDRAQFPGRSNDRAALGGARELVLGLLDKPARGAQR